MGGRNYFKELLIEANLSFIVVPSWLTTVMIASAIPAAIRPYSIAVAPDSSDQNFETIRFKDSPPFLFQGALVGSNVRKSTEDNLRSS